ncbi:VOC family protein [Pseudomethylobacillus aquaticus]|nr:VOC family protein [Pseudomethylobacillus aquaticus]
MQAQRPGGMQGLHHVALFVTDLDASLQFYRDVVGMQEEWQPDPDNIYLSSGADNLALHRLPADADLQGQQRLDHIGFIMATPEHVDQWHAHLLAHGTRIAQAPRTHRDGARSLYCLDPCGNLVQFIYHPPISPLLATLSAD